MKHILYFLIIMVSLSSCLDGSDANIPDSDSGSFVEMIYNPGGKLSTANSGLQYFANAALTYPATDKADTTSFVVSIQGASPATKDVTISLSVDNSSLNVNYATDSITYLAMPDSLYDFINTTAVIKAGERSAKFQVIFYPSKIDPSQNYALPVTSTNDADITTSTNFGHIYFHVIGNPLAGSYLWDFYRYNTETVTGSPTTTWTNESTVFAPVSPTSFKVKTGYYVQPNYLISFSSANGVLSNFKAVIAPDEIKTAFTDNGITVVSGPTITVNEDQTKFTVNYVVYNGSAYRNLTDIYHK
ncbi:DUF1735 domain-containing protein [Ohtaekwangia sp.]|uniref:DUF1735 domain-containing protein n=1 Tax=Ohtaekwangia sp. TaxID=2066019 RepID=UPI002F93C210